MPANCSKRDQQQYPDRCPYRTDYAGLCQQGRCCHLAKSVAFETIVANDYNLSVSSYVEAKDNREIINIAELNAELKTTVSKIDQLRKDIDSIVAEIEGDEVQE
jgi:type I restriction-modification system DNA methylase subunit